MINKESLISSTQYATGWTLLVLFSWSFILPLFIPNLPGHPLLLPIIVVTFFTHATLGIRSTARRYHILKPWMDWLFLLLWLSAVSAFLINYTRFFNSIQDFL